MLALTLILPALALEPTFNASVAGSLFSEGAKVAAVPGLKQGLWGDPDSTLFSDTFLSVEASLSATPSYARFGPVITFSPIAVLELEGHYLFSPYFGSFSSVVGYDQPDDPWTDEISDAAIEAGNRGGGMVTQVGGTASLFGAVDTSESSRILLVLSANMDRWEADIADHVVGEYWYEPEVDLLIARRDTTLGQNMALLFEKKMGKKRQLRAGALGTAAQALGTEASWAKVGPLGTYDWNKERWQVLLLVQPYLQHPVHTAPVPPYIGTRLKWTMH